jgi:hypothetical protein
MRHLALAARAVARWRLGQLHDRQAWRDEVRSVLMIQWDTRSGYSNADYLNVTTLRALERAQIMARRPGLDPRQHGPCSALGTWWAVVLNLIDAGDFAGLLHSSLL